MRRSNIDRSKPHRIAFENNTKKKNVTRNSHLYIWLSVIARHSLLICTLAVMSYSQKKQEKINFIVDGQLQYSIYSVSFSSYFFLFSFSLDFNITLRRKKKIPEESIIWWAWPHSGGRITIKACLVCLPCTISENESLCLRMHIWFNTYSLHLNGCPLVYYTHIASAYWWFPIVMLRCEYGWVHSNAIGPKSNTIKRHQQKQFKCFFSSSSFFDSFWISKQKREKIYIKKRRITTTKKWVFQFKWTCWTVNENICSISVK